MTVLQAHPLLAAHLSRRVWVGMLAGGLALPVLSGSVADGAMGQTSRTPVAGSAGLAVKGITYDTGTRYTEWNVLSRPIWDSKTVKRDLNAIRETLHCTAVALFGIDIARLVQGAEMALEQGLAVWLQPRLFDVDQGSLLNHLVETAREAERLRAAGHDVTLNLGVELSLFAQGIIPGATFEERIPILIETIDQLPTYNERLNALLADALAAAREVFNGPVTYGSGEWEGVDWSGFDYVGVDLYRDAYNRDTYVQRLRSYQRFGKPVIITEFGCCTYEGAEDAGGSGYDIIDWETEPPQLNGEYVRSELTQAATIGSLLDLYETEGVHGAFVYTFVEPGQTWSPDPRYDLDMASFGVVKILPEDTGRGYDTTGSWEPKAAFWETADQYAVN